MTEQSETAEPSEKLAVPDERCDKGRALTRGWRAEIEERPHMHDRWRAFLR